MVTAGARFERTRSSAAACSSQNPLRTAEARQCGNDLQTSATAFGIGSFTCGYRLFRRRKCCLLFLPAAGQFSVELLCAQLLPFALLRVWLNRNLVVLALVGGTDR